MTDSRVACVIYYAPDCTDELVSTCYRTKTRWKYWIDPETQPCQWERVLCFRAALVLVHIGVSESRIAADVVIIT